jgi:hypothetical protein
MPNPKPMPKRTTAVVLPGVAVATKKKPARAVAPAKPKRAAQSMVLDKTKPMPKKQNLPSNTSKPKAPLKPLGAKKK